MASSRTLLIGDAYPKIPSGTTAVYRTQIVDDSVPPVPVSASALNTLTLTIVDTNTRAVINGVLQTNILNVNRGIIDNAGNLKLTLGGPNNPTDTGLQNPDRQQERRSIIIDWTFSAGQKSGSHEAEFLIVRMSGA